MSIKKTLEIHRSLLPQIRQDLEQKIVLLSGPRQVGKTHLSQELFPGRSEYLSFDSIPHRKIIRDQSWSRKWELIIFDEIHKMKEWKRWIKGIYDTEGVRPRLLATGSARMDIFKRGGESLAGRHHLHRLHPLSVAELKGILPPQETLTRIIQFGGFPEPFLSQDQETANRWRMSHLDRIIREDLIDLERVREVKQLEILVELLSERVGGTLSYASLAKDLQVSPHTVKKWIQILERLFVIFVVTPYTKNIALSILKEPKIYFYDTGRVTALGGARLENAVACALLKRQHFLEDTRGETLSLHYLKDKSHREVDFITLRKKTVEYLIEVKESDDQPSNALKYFGERLKPVKTMQLVQKLNRELQFGRIEILEAARWLASLEG
jgi:predicted AAA+ superfamily ATPase